MSCVYLYELCKLYELCNLCKLYGLCKSYELCKLYEYFMNWLKSLEITWFFFSKNLIFFLLIYKDGKSKLQKRKYWEKILKQYAAEPIFKGKE